MKNFQLWLSCSALAIFLCGNSAFAQDRPDTSKAWQQVVDKAANTSFVVLSGPPENDVAKFNSRAVGFLNNVLGESKVKDMSVSSFQPTEAMSNLLLVPLPPDALKKTIEDRKLQGEVSQIVPNGIVYGFAEECEDEENFPGTERMPKGVERVAKDIDNGNGFPDDYSGAKTIYVIDSGISPLFDMGTTPDELNVVGRRVCDSSNCNPVANDPDNIGHGTMIAGIAAARKNSKGIVGIVPNAKLVSLKIFDSTVAATTFDVAFKALETVATLAQSGDVVNLSWGMEWDPNPDSIQSKIEAKLKQLADSGIQVVIAAGNLQVLGGSGYVATVSPARAGGYRASSGGGGIYTVSAVRSRAVSSSDWKDRFWRDSAYGNPQRDAGGAVVGKGPPDFAEPGVDIESLWPGVSAKVRTCSGTSFAAAHLTGILVRGMPMLWPSGSEKRADRDPSAIRPNLTGYVDALKDLVAVSPDFKPM